MMMPAPILQTERLRLRPHAESDFDACLALWSDERTVRFIGGQVQSAQAVWFRLLRYAGLWSLLGFGYWVFEERETGRYLGEGGLADMHRGIDLLIGVPEIGWALSPDAGGRGLASEAVDAITQWGDTVLKAPLTRCIIEPGNIPSLRVAEKCGYRAIYTADMDGTRVVVLERVAAAN